MFAFNSTRTGIEKSTIQKLNKKLPYFKSSFNPLRKESGTTVPINCSLIRQDTGSVSVYWIPSYMPYWKFIGVLPHVRIGAALRGGVN